jgi:hypothetical protein
MQTKQPHQFIFIASASLGHSVIPNCTQAANRSGFSMDRLKKRRSTKFSSEKHPTDLLAPVWQSSRLDAVLNRPGDGTPMLSAAQARISAGFNKSSHTSGCVFAHRKPAQAGRPMSCDPLSAMTA